MIDYMKNMLIGLFVAVACGLVVGMILFLEPSVGDGKQTLIMRFANINGISVGTRVMFAGKPVGEVYKIEQIPDAREQPTDENGQVYFYQLILHVDSSVRVYNTDEFTIQTSGLLGEKSIAVIPRAPPKGVTPKRITARTPIYADSVDPLESIFNEMGSVADKVEEALDKMVAWVDQNGAELGSAIRSFDDAMAEIAIAIERVNRLHVVDDVQVAIQNFGNSMLQLNHAMQTLADGHTFENISDTMQNIRAASRAINVISNNVADGRGTIGKLFSDDNTYLRVTSVLSKVDTLLNDVNQYGLLFNYNKEWQRTRVKQVSMLNALKSPANFRSYFQNEVDMINTSMGRLSMLIEKAESAEQSKRILETPAFRKDFAELMRRTQDLIDNLKLYNEQLAEASQESCCP